MPAICTLQVAKVLKSATLFHLAVAAYADLDHSGEALQGSPSVQRRAAAVIGVHKRESQCQAPGLRGS